MALKLNRGCLLLISCGVVVSLTKEICVAEKTKTTVIEIGGGFDME